MRMFLRTPHFKTKQTGAALITALTILLVLTVIGVSALKMSSLEEIIVGNMRDQVLAFNAAESAITDGQDTINALTAIPTATASGSSGIYERDTFGDFSSTFFDYTNTWNNATEYGTAGTQDLNGVSADPLFLIEEEAFYTDDLNPETAAQGLGRFYYRITSRGVGNSPNSVIVLQEVYARRYK
jgi:type IV pilus assembly protein PilX